MCSERNAFTSSLSFFFFFFVARFSVGENTSLLPCWSNTSSAQGASDLLALFERRHVSLYPRQTMRQLRKVCHAEGVLCLSSWPGNKPSKYIADEAFLARCWSGRLPQSGKGQVSLEPGPSRARYFPRDMLLLTATAHET